jgi:anti-sigma factor RsiW
MPDPRDANIERLEEIVAYLDGELSPAECARVEQRLASDEAFRQQLQGMERAWKALDELPLAVVDDKFAKTTMEITVATAAAEIKAKTVALPIQRRRRRWSSWLGAFAAAAVGFMIIRLAWQNPDRMLLADLPVIDNVDIYSQFQQPEFLVSLRNELGQNFEEIGGRPSDLTARLERFQTISQPQERDRWLRGVSDRDNASLRAKFNRFRELQPDEQKRLRELHAEVVASPIAPKLEETMLAYDEWLSGLPPGRQFELAQLPIDERLRTVKRWAREMRDDAALTLSEDELTQLFQKMRGPFEQLRQETAKDVAKLPADQRRFLAAIRQFRDNVAAPGPFQTALIQALPERTRQPFEHLPPQQKVARFTTWLRQMEAPRGQASQEQLEKFFAEDLDASTKEELLSLPPVEMQQALQRLYRRQPGQGLGGPWALGHDGQRGPGGPGGGPGRAWQGGPSGGPREHGGPGRPDFNGRGPEPEGPGGPGDRPMREGPGPRGGRRPPPDFGRPPRRPPPEDEMDRGPGPRPGA